MIYLSETKHNNMRTLLVIALTPILFISCQNTRENETECSKQLKLIDTQTTEADDKWAELARIGGVSEFEHKDRIREIADYTKAIELDPNDAEVYYFRGSSKLFIGQKDSGCYDLSKAAELGFEQGYDLIRENCN